MLKAMMIIAMLGGVEVNERSEFNTMGECSKSRQIILKQDDAAQVFCIPLGKPSGMANAEALMDRFLIFIQQMHDMETVKGNIDAVPNTGGIQLKSVVPQDYSR
jgi:hypothetical protein